MGPRAVVLYLRAEKKNCTKSRASRWVGLRPIPLSAAGVELVRHSLTVATIGSTVAWLASAVRSRRSDRRVFR